MKLLADGCRADFPMLKRTMHGKPLIYLDSAATAQKPQKVIDAIADFYANSYASVMRAIYEISEIATRHYRKGRESAARLLNARTTDELIFTRGTTDSINLAAHSIGKSFIQEGDSILISAMEHHSNLVPWQFVAEERKAQLLVAPITERGDLDIESYSRLVATHNPKVVAITHISNVLGTVNPIKELAAIAHHYGALFLVDGAQAVAHIPIDVQDLDVDFYAFSGHKLYGPTGVGILYGRSELLEKMPPRDGGGAMVDRVTFEKTTFARVPWKFEAGTMMLAEIAGLAAAIEYVTDCGLDQIQKWEGTILDYAVKELQKIEGVQVIGSPRHRESVISFVVDGIHPLDLGTFLDLEGIAIRTGHHCAQPLMAYYGVDAMARVSVGLYNNKADIDTFIAALKKVMKKLLGSTSKMR